MKTPTTLSGAPEIQPTHKSGALKIVTTQILSAFAALGITASVTENAEGATILVGSLPAVQTTTDRTNATQHVEGVTSNTIHIPYAPNGGELTVGINWQIDSTQLGGDINSTVDLGFSLERRFNGGTPVTLVDTNPIPALPRTTIGLSSDTYDRSGTLYDTWSIGPVTDPAGIDIPLIYTGITDSRLEGSQANFGGAIPGSHSSPMDVSFTPIPETSVGTLAGIAGTLALLRRKRRDTESTNTTV